MKKKPRFTGLCMTIPDDVVFQDWLTGEPVIRRRTEQAVRVPLLRLTPTPA
jgi:hypothetical protein